MKTKGGKFTFPSKPIILTIFFLLVVVLVVFLRSSSLPQSHQPLSCPPIKHLPLETDQTCNKISPTTAETLVHYVTSNITPQQTYKEISVSLRVLTKKSPCNFLVFGLGNCSDLDNARKLRGEMSDHMQQGNVEVIEYHNLDYYSGYGIYWKGSIAVLSACSHSALVDQEELDD
ncbi:glucuronoxylan 4-O-methyltransferase 3-like protein [Tanacetum coccineum]